MFVVYSLVWHVVVQKVAVDEQAAEIFGGGVKTSAGSDQSVPQVMTQLSHAGDLSETVVCNELQSDWPADSVVQKVL